LVSTRCDGYAFLRTGGTGDYAPAIEDACEVDFAFSDAEYVESTEASGGAPAGFGW